MTCAVNWIIVRDRRAESTSLSHPDLAGSRGKTVSGHLELSPDAEIIRMCERTGGKRQTASDHYSSSLALGSGELKVTDLNI